MSCSSFWKSNYFCLEENCSFQNSSDWHLRSMVAGTVHHPKATATPMCLIQHCQKFLPFIGPLSCQSFIDRQVVRPKRKKKQQSRTIVRIEVPPYWLATSFPVLWTIIRCWRTSLKMHFHNTNFQLKYPSQHPQGKNHFFKGKKTTTNLFPFFSGLRTVILVTYNSSETPVCFIYFMICNVALHTALCCCIWNVESLP